MAWYLNGILYDISTMKMANTDDIEGANVS